MLPIRCCNQGSLYRADFVFKCPVTALLRRTREIRRRRNITVCQLRELVHEGITTGALGDIAAIDENIAAGMQRLTDGIKFRISRIERGRRVGCIAQMQLAGLAMRDDMDGIEPRAPLQELCDLAESILARIEHDNFGAGADGLFDGGRIFDIGIDKDNDFGGCITLDDDGAIHMRAEARDFEADSSARARFGRWVSGIGSIVVFHSERIAMQGVDGRIDSGRIEHDARLQATQQGLGAKARKGVRALWG